MQGPWELGLKPGHTPPLSGPRSVLTEAAGEIAPCQACEDSCAGQAPGKQRGADAQWVRTPSHQAPWDGEARTPGLSQGTCAACGPGPAEHSSAWGEFEGFRESSAEFEQFSQSSELPEQATAPELPGPASARKECGSQHPCPSGAGATAPPEPIPSYENIFRFAFQEVPGQQVTDDVPALHHLLEISDEEEPGHGCAHKCCPESRKLWRALQSAHSMATSHCLWHLSRCQENLLLVLGVDATQNLSRGPGPVLEGSELQEPTGFGVPSFRLHHCRALIQTTLLGTPGGRQGSLVTCSLFLQTPIPGSERCTTAPRTKLFSPRSLKVTLSQ